MLYTQQQKTALKEQQLLRRQARQRAKAAARNDVVLWSGFIREPLPRLTWDAVRRGNLSKTSKPDALVADTLAALVWHGVSLPIGTRFLAADMQLSGPLRGEIIRTSSERVRVHIWPLKKAGNDVSPMPPVMPAFDLEDLAEEGIGR